MDIFFADYDYERSKQWLRDHEGFLLKSVATYVIAIFTIKFVMRDRKPFGLQRPLALWNAALALFSIAGFVRTTPVFWRTIAEKGVQHTYTEVGALQKDSIAGYWAFVWCVSKIPEFIDTIFIVLRKKPLIFMHWYHHALTGYFAFVTFYEDNAYMVWVVWMNYFIHSIMYTYFWARAANIRIHPKFAQWLTGAQIVQFMITHAVMEHLLWLAYTTSKSYAVTARGFIIGQVMETTYLLLWFRFYYISYMASGGKKYVQYKNAMQQQKTNGALKAE